MKCSHYETVHFGESKRYSKLLSDEHKRSVKNCDCEKNEIAKHCQEVDHNFSWDQKKVVDRESRLITRQIKETKHSLRNSNHINKVFYMLPEIWLPNFNQSISENPFYGLSDCNGIRTHNHLVRKRTLNHLQPTWQSLKPQISRLFRARRSLTFRQLQSVDKTQIAF